ncbi:3-oxo-5-alpha-steroid 4-dehydrogenase family protein [Grosmannia clavigera kw1407]|uniref:3-oxo-5-alpha-steroid 4-dehydrogenase family protein n=1 Tax=Grosmannia clavigera (strain kw1407 / UAMH 11150) TaxID=655863 RepID=F0X6S3_GROCL|nr:3-oxo-5-alpha-steroid 4-dehydrogenase family protein [Grosmannia clavigera kw1407]EFX06309.1 3-oxo-5-alpha-steroid 4-dehydrogenase family protein [Grosmannia clavigera kw1407]
MFGRPSDVAGYWRSKLDTCGDSFTSSRRLSSLQWAIKWYGMGKTSVQSVLNIPGRIGWLTMECPGFLTLMYIMNTLTKQEGIDDLPWQNKVQVIHYIYRAILFPLMAPSMSPMHVLVWCMGVIFQLVNATCLGSFLAAYGPRTAADWRTQLAPWPTLQFVVGITVFYLGLTVNFICDDDLREIRRRAALKRDDNASDSNGGSGSAVQKLYLLPDTGLFRYMLYPHYFAEWVEWTGFYMAAGWGCVPARMFLLNEVAAMLPRAVSGKRWYIERFGADRVGKRRAVIPGVL